MKNKFKNEESAKDFFKTYKKEHPKTQKSWADFYEKPQKEEMGDTNQSSVKSSPLTPKQQQVVTSNLQKLHAEIEEPKKEAINSNRDLIVKAAKGARSIPVLMKGLAAFAPYASNPNRDVEEAAQALSQFSEKGAEFGKDAYKLLFKGGAETLLKGQTDKVLMPVAQSINDSIGSTVAHSIQSLPEFAAKRLIAKAPGISSTSVKVRDEAIKKFLEDTGVGFVKKKIPGVAFVAYKGVKFGFGVAGLTMRAGASVMQIPIDLTNKITNTETPEQLANKSLKTVAKENISAVKDFYKPDNRKKVAKEMMDTNRQVVSDTLRLMSSLLTKEDPIASIDRLSSNAGKIAPSLGRVSKDMLDSIYRQGLLEDGEAFAKQLAVAHLTGAAVKGIDAKIQEHVPKDFLKGMPSRTHYDAVMRDYVKREVANTPSGAENFIRKKGAEVFFNQIYKKTFKRLDEVSENFIKDKPRQAMINQTFVSPNINKAYNKASTFRTYVSKAVNMTVGKVADVIDTEPTNQKKAAKNELTPQSFIEDCYDNASEMDPIILEALNTFPDLESMMDAGDEELFQAILKATKEDLLNKLKEAKQKDAVMEAFLSEVYNFDQTDLEVILNTLQKEGGLSEKGLIEALKENLSHE